MPRIPRSVSVALLFSLAAAIASCRAPQQRANLHYRPAAIDGWRNLGAGRYGQSLNGVAIEVSMPADAPQLELSLVNEADGGVVVRLGPDAMRAGTTAIGEVQLRHADRGRQDGTTDYLPYLAMQDFEIPPGGRAVFYLDSPLGREPALGQYFVLVIELRRDRARLVRSLLPMQATNVPEQPSSVPESSSRRP